MNILGFAPITQQRDACGDELRVSSSDVQNQSLFLPLLLQLFGANAAIAVKAESQNEMPANSLPVPVAMDGISKDSVPQLPFTSISLSVKEASPGGQRLPTGLPTSTSRVVDDQSWMDYQTGGDRKAQVQSAQAVVQHFAQSKVVVNEAVSSVVPKDAQNGMPASQNEVATESLAKITDNPELFAEAIVPVVADERIATKLGGMKVQNENTKGDASIASLVEAIVPVVADESILMKHDGVKVHDETIDEEASVSAAIREVRSSMQKPVGVQPNIISFTASGFQPAKDEAKVQPEFARTLTREDAASLPTSLKADATHDIIVNFTTPKANDPKGETAKAVDEANIFVSNESPNARTFVTQSQGNDESNSPSIAKPIVNKQELQLKDVKAITVEHKDFAFSELPDSATSGLVEKQKPETANAHSRFTDTAVEQKPDIASGIKSETTPPMFRQSKKEESHSNSGVLSENRQKLETAKVETLKSVDNNTATVAPDVRRGKMQEEQTKVLPQRSNNTDSSLTPKMNILPNAAGAVANVDTISRRVEPSPFPQASMPEKGKIEEAAESSTNKRDLSGYDVAAEKKILVETVTSDFAKTSVDNSKEFDPVPQRKENESANTVLSKSDDVIIAAPVDSNAEGSQEGSATLNLTRPTANVEAESVGKSTSQNAGLHPQQLQTLHATANAHSKEVLSNAGASLSLADLSQTVLDQVSKNLAFSLKAKSSEIRVALKPESLGELVMKVKMDDGKVSAQIDVSNVTVKAVLEANIAQLRDALTSRGIEVQRIDIVADGQNVLGNSTGQNKSKQKSQNKNAASVDAIDRYESLRTMGYNTMELTM
jgi:flagellar hook-length control protein FliK